MVRSGLFDDVKDFQDLPEGSKNIVRKKTVNEIITRYFKESKEKGKTVGPFLWDAWKLDKNKLLVGCMYAKVDESGNVVDITGSFFEVRMIKNENFIRWLFWEKNDNGEYFDPVTKKYADKVDEIKKEYSKFWND
jgi:hypothetical protein